MHQPHLSRQLTLSAEPSSRGSRQFLHKFKLGDLCQVHHLGIGVRFAAGQPSQPHLARKRQPSRWQSASHSRWPHLWGVWPCQVSLQLSSSLTLSPTECGT